MSDCLFTPTGDGRFEPTEHARGPWDPRALHGGAPAALIARAFERMEPGAELAIARLGFEFLKPIPLTPLTLRTRFVREGRRVQELAGDLTAASGGGDGPGEELVCRASALRIQPVPGGLPGSGQAPADTMPGPEHGKAAEFSLNKTAGTSLASTGMEMSWLTDPRDQGPGKVWMRLRQPILPDEPATPLVRLVAAADFGNGVSAELPFDGYLFINADLTIHLVRAPEGGVDRARRAHTAARGRHGHSGKRAPR